MQQDAGGSAAFTEKSTHPISNEANEATYTTFTTINLFVYTMLLFGMRDRCCNLSTGRQMTPQVGGDRASGECDSLLTHAQLHYAVDSFGLKAGLRAESNS